MKRLAIVLAIIIFFIAAAWILFIRFTKQIVSPQVQPSFTFLLSSSTPPLSPAKNRLFYVNQSGIFSYDVATGKALQIAAINASTSVFNGQRIGDDTIGFEVGQAYSNETSSVYMLDLASNALTKEADIGGNGAWFVDNLDFVAPGEFVYTEASETSTMIDNYESVLLFKNGTTTRIGYISNPGEYGSTLSSSPDGKHIFFAGQIYSMTAKSWTSVPKKCQGPESAWLNNDVVILKWESDGNSGDICYYDIHSGTEGDVGPAEGFNVAGNNIFYMHFGTTSAGLFQILQYDYATHAARVIIPNARLWSYYHYDMDGSPGVVYQPVMSSGTCFELDCLGGIATGNLMMFNTATGSSTPLGFGSVENVTDLF